MNMLLNSNFRKFPSSGKNLARGFTLVEALVTLLVLSIGLLGVAAMQLASLRSNHSASLRSQATLLAYEIVDRMRANRNAACAGAYDIALTVDPATGTVAGDDLDSWKQNLGATLGDGDGAISRVVNPVGNCNHVFQVTVRWDDSRGEGDPLIVDFTLETQI
jgi:type IV pilus assembly protein PilV